MYSEHPSLDPRAVQDPVVRADAISVVRGNDRVLDGLNLTVNPGEVVAIQGVSGAGKSTLLAALCGLLVPAEGALHVENERLDQQSERRRSAVRLRTFGLVFQGDELLPELTLGENISLPLRLIHRPRRKGHYLESIEPLATALGINTLLDRRPAEVSGGQLQRAAIARSIVHTPRVVLADEPTASLDTQSASDALRLLIELARQQGAAVIVVTHDDAVAERGDRRLVLINGRLEEIRIESPIA